MNAENIYLLLDELQEAKVEYGRMRDNHWHDRHEAGNRLEEAWKAFCQASKEEAS